MCLILGISPRGNIQKVDVSGTKILVAPLEKRGDRSLRTKIGCRWRMPARAAP